MSADARQVINTTTWKQWENRVVSDVFPLRRFLGGTDNSAVFLTEYKAKNLPDVAIKFVAADAVQVDVQLAHWRAAARHPHPQLVRLFAVGRCLSAGREFLFVVMEYAEQTLAELLPQRALNPLEVREMLPSMLDTLAFLHKNHLVHSQLKPSNFMVVNDQLKLASDTIRPIGTSAGQITSSYGPPELKGSGMSPAGDIWAVGITLIEALTQRAPPPYAQYDAADLPPGFPASFVDTVRECLSPIPANRPAAAKLAAHFKAAPLAQFQPPPGKAPQAAVAKTQKAAKRSLLLPVIVAALLISVAVWAGFRFSGTQQARVQPTATPAVTPAVVAAAPVASTPAPVTVAQTVEAAGLSGNASSQTSSLPAPEPTSPSVVQEIIPEVSQEARDKIQGHIYVTLRVLVDPAGDVFAQMMEKAGPNKRFARLAEKAAGEWKFVPAEVKGARVWLLRFDFSRDGVTARATAM